jgi:hypothetical protein
MKIENIVKALEKVGLKVHKTLLKDFGEGLKTYLYVCQGKSNHASWYEQTPNEEIRGVYIISNGVEDDLRSDYHAGTFYDTIRSIVARMKK